MCLYIWPRWRWVSYIKIYLYFEKLRIKLSDPSICPFCRIYLSINTDPNKTVSIQLHIFQFSIFRVQICGTATATAPKFLDPRLSFGHLVFGGCRVTSPVECNKSVKIAWREFEFLFLI